MKQINGVCFPDIDVSTPKMIEKSKIVSIFGFQINNLNSALKYVTNWSIAIDGGANIGTWSYRLSNHFKKVYAFELAPDTYKCLCNNVKYWQIDKQVETANQAISNKQTYVGVANGTSKHPRSGGRHIQGQGNIPTIMLDDLDLPNLGFLKLDLEGHEAKALEGARHILSKFKPVVLIENKPKLAKRYKHNLSAVNILTEMGARVVEKVGNHQSDWIFSW